MLLIILTANKRNLWLFFGPQTMSGSRVACCPGAKAREGTLTEGKYGQRWEATGEGLIVQGRGLVLLGWKSPWQEQGTGS